MVMVFCQYKQYRTVNTTSEGERSVWVTRCSFDRVTRRTVTRRLQQLVRTRRMVHPLTSPRGGSVRGMVRLGLGLTIMHKSKIYSAITLCDHARFTKRQATLYTVRTCL